MKKPAPRAVRELLPGALPQIADRLVHFRIQRAWGAVMGHDVARRSRPDSFIGWTLRVVVDTSPWLHEMTLRAPDLAATLRERFPEVHALKFTLGSLETDPAAARASAPPRAVPLSTADHADIDAATAANADQVLAE